MCEPRQDRSAAALDGRRFDVDRHGRRRGRRPDVQDGASWRTATSVTVSGTGVLGIEGNRTFSGKTDLVVTGGTADRIRIAAGKKLIVKSLTVNGEPLTSVPAGLVTGGGDLQIGPDGLILVVR